MRAEIPRFAARCFSLTLAVWFALAVTARAQTTGVSNLSFVTGDLMQASKGPSITTFSQAFSFTTGGTEAGLTSVSLNLAVTSALASGFSLSLYTAIDSTGPSNLVTTFGVGSKTSATNYSGTPGGIYSFSPTVAATLASAQTYWLVARGTSTNTSIFLLGTHNTDEDAGGLAGWSISQTRWSSNNSEASWFIAGGSSIPSFSVTVTSAIPEPAELASVMALAGLAVVLAKRRWGSTA